MEEYEIIKKMIFDSANEIAYLKSENERLNEIIKNTPQNFNVEQKSLSKESFEDMLVEYLEKHGLTYHLSLILNPYLEKEDESKTYESKDDAKLTELNNVSEDKIYIPNTKNKIGFCKIENNKHYFCLNEKECYLLMGIDDKTYFQQGQFVSVDENYFFKWSHKYIHIPSEDAVSEYLRVSYDEGKLSVLNADNVSVKINFPKYSNFKDGQIISIDQSGQFSRFYKPSKFSYENYVDSIYSRELKVTIPKSINTSTILLEDVKTKELFTVNYDISDAIKLKVDEESVVILNKNLDIVNVIQSQYFLKSN